MSVRGQAVVLALLLELIARAAWRRAFVSLREKIRSTPDSSAEVVDVPEWDVKIEVRSMTAKVRARMLRECVDPQEGTMDFEKLYPALLVACCFDPEQNEPVFVADDVGWINEKASGPVERLAQAGMRLSGLSREAVDAGKGDSSKSPTSGTSSTLPSDSGEPSTNS